jgi:hypothetical protein
MNIRGDYDATQDRIVLTLRAGGEGAWEEDRCLWLTRRQWVAIASACYRKRSAMIDRRENDEGQSHPKTEADRTPNPAPDDEERNKAVLVSQVKFTAVSSGLRVRLTTPTPESFLLPLRGENFKTFIKLVERLATKANWDLPAAISRIDNAAWIPKPLVN